MACILGTVYQSDYRNHAQSMGLVLAPWTHANIGKVSEAEFRSAVANDVQLVDARYAQDFAKGTITNALNIPVNLTIEQIQPLAAQLDKTGEIIVFCQSKNCAFDERVAKRLSLLGFVNVRASEIGWYEFSLNRTEKQDGD